MKTSDALIFHLPNLQAEKNVSPKYRRLDQIWIILVYESAQNVIYGYLIIIILTSLHDSKLYSSLRHTKHKMNLDKIAFNRTMSFRQDSDILIQYGSVTKLSKSLTNSEMMRMYPNIGIKFT